MFLPTNEGYNILWVFRIYYYPIRSYVVHKNRLVYNILVITKL